MTKIIRNLSTEENRKFWDSAEKIAKQVEDWPDSRRAGINVSQFRQSNEMTIEDVLTKYREILKKKLGSGWRPKDDKNVQSVRIDTAKPLHSSSDLGEIYHVCQHLLWMMDELNTMLVDTSVDMEKCNRWLGFIQGTLWSYGIYSIDDMREDNR